MSLKLWDCNTLPQQLWGYDATMNTIYLTHSATAASLGNADNTSGLGSSLGASMCMDITGGAVADGTKIDVWECNSCWNQQFQVIGPAAAAELGVELGSCYMESQVADGCPNKPSPGPTPRPAP